MRSISSAIYNILPDLIDLIRDHGIKNWANNAPCECCGEKIYKYKPKEGVIGTVAGCYCADCIEDFLEFMCHVS